MAIKFLQIVARYGIEVHSGHKHFPSPSSRHLVAATEGPAISEASYRTHVVTVAIKRGFLNG